MKVDGIFIAVGIHPETKLCNNLVSLDAAGYCLADETCKTSVPGIYVAGDIRKKPMRQVITAVADGANAVNSAASYIMGLYEQSVCNVCKWKKRLRKERKKDYKK